VTLKSSSFCDDSNLYTSIFEKELSTMRLSKESVRNFRNSISREVMHHQF